MNQNSRIEDVIATLGASAPRSLTQFARQFLRNQPTPESGEDAAADLASMLTGIYEFQRHRHAGEVKIRVFNPDPAHQGWHSAHTVVELVNDDMPFLVDSVALALTRLDYGIHLILHPVMRMRRDQGGHFLSVAADEEDAAQVASESLMHLRIDRQTSPDALAEIERAICRTLKDVRLAVQDWQPMTRKALEIADELAESAAGLEASDLDEARAFFKWLADDHFTFLGYREYEIIEHDSERVLTGLEGSGLGLMRDDHRRSPPRRISDLGGGASGDGRIHPIIITKTNGRATVHRDGYMDYISVLRFDADGRVSGEKRIIGLFTSGAYIRRCSETPLVRGKVERVLQRSGLRPGSHAAKALRHILEILPRDELFQSQVDDLSELSLGILELQERSQTRVFIRRERFGRFYSCMVFIPRDRFNTENRRKIQSILKRALKGDRLDFAVQVGDSRLARMHLIVRCSSERGDRPDLAAIEERIKRAIRSWDDELGEILVRQHGEEQGLRLMRRFAHAFPLSYQSDVAPHVASHDVVSAANLRGPDELRMSLYRPRQRDAGIVRFKLFIYDRPIPLSDVLPMLENLGMRIVSERPYALRLSDGGRIWIQDFEMQTQGGGELDLDGVRELFQDAFEQTWRGACENDGFNRLVLLARLNWRQAAMLRACARFLQQAGSPFSQNYMEQTLAAWPLAARLLIETFEARFDPARRDEGRTARQAARKCLERQCRELSDGLGDPVLDEFIGELAELRGRESCDEYARQARRTLLRLLDSVASADQDRILRSFADVIAAMLRTNFFQTAARGQHAEYMSFKFDSSQLPELPRPRPFREIWVYSPRVEGVHLRGGRIARGGLRWSDRREDFRTEVLGLMKAQNVKNTMIVPVGAKGGFFVKQQPVGEGRERLMAEVVYCYRAFIDGLLSITDNLDGENVRPPPQVIRHDEEDPYLVVAADKGTAAFSDIANSISLDRGFWLGDAFASGGSNGYDHKKMGITAKGAWESVKRHFRELGLDTQSEPFDVVGIGDMSGDVFGNGMLLSEHIRLKAAFNHMHIFIDPTPDPGRGFAERRRLFETPGSNWSDYERESISPGGGVYSRQAKTVAITSEVRDWLGIEEQELSPQALIRALLTANYDLLWNGGIGTYVKAASETHADVGDLANNPVRVNGNDLRCRVIGEGGNLGLTQKGRIEYALNGGRINTDFIDNAAGVDCSDHEVNIKILLDQAVGAGRLDQDSRNLLLAQMTDEVESLVLRSNYLQTQALSMMESLTSKRLGAEAHFITMLEHQGVIDRDLEYLPDEEQLRERVAQGRGLMRPELAVLLSYAKITLYAELLASDVPEDPYLASELEDYFPQPLREGFSDLMPAHRLRREIIATRVTNNMVNRMGAYFAMRVREDTGASSATIAKAYTVAREILEARTCWRELELYDRRVSASIQTQSYIEMWNLVRQCTRRLIALPGFAELDISSKVERLGQGMQQFREQLPQLLCGQDVEQHEQRREERIAAGFEEEFAGRLASLAWMHAALDVVDEARHLGRDVADVGRIYFALLDELCLRWLRDSVEELPVDKQWHAHARGNLRDGLSSHHRLLARRILTEHGDDDRPVAAWMERHAEFVERTRAMLEEMRGGAVLDFATLHVAINGIGQLLAATSET